MGGTAHRPLPIRAKVSDGCGDRVVGEAAAVPFEECGRTWDCESRVDGDGLRDSGLDSVVTGYEAQVGDPPFQGKL
jgi:hypothetical protein